MPQSTMLSGLTPGKDDDTIHVRVGRIWGAMKNKTNTCSHTNIILIDEQQNHIMATIPNKQRELYLPLLKKHGVYNIAYFKVVRGPALYRSVDREFAIKFFYRTKIEENPDKGVIPLYKFELQPFDKVKALAGQVKCLIDVIGMVLSYGQFEKNSDDGPEKMDVILINERKKSVMVTLYEAQARQFLELLASVEDNLILVVITGLLANKPSAIPSLSTTDATCCYVNINYAPLIALKDALPLAVIDTRCPLHIPTADKYFKPTGEIIQELPIKSILGTVIPMGTQVIHRICRAKIVAILDINGWFYNCCPTCPRELRPLDGKFYCLVCDEETQSLAQHYRVQVHVQDHSGFTTITLYDKQAEQLVGIPLQQILPDQREDDKMIPIHSAINNILGKVCAFHLEITPYNIIQGCKEYTSTRVFEATIKGSRIDKLPASTIANTHIDRTTRKRHKLA